jgi:hypothetical protein
MGTIRLPDFPQIPDIPTLDAEDTGRRIGNFAQRLVEKPAKRVGEGIGGTVTFGINIVNDILNSANELTK